MLKKLFFFILIFISLTLTSCTNIENIDLSQLENIIKDSVNLENYSKGNSKELRKFFNINSDDIAEYIIYTPAYSMDVNEFLIIKVKNSSDINSIKDTIDLRVEGQIATFGSYGPKQCALLEDYILKSKGNYIFYCVAQDNEKIYEIFKESIE